MPWNGAGVFQRIYSWATDQANGVLVRADRMDTDSNDIAAGISNCIARDGQAAPTADISWGSRKLTNLANGAASADAVNFGQVFTGPTFNGMTATGTVTFSGATAVTVPTVATTDNSTNAASTAYVTQKAFATALPAQGGNAGKFITTDGTTASWGLPWPAQPGGTPTYKLNSTGGATAWNLDLPPTGSVLYLNANCGGF